MSNTTYNLSELIKTDCYIDCGSNEKLRDVVEWLPVKAGYLQIVGGIYDDDVFIRIFSDVKNSEYCTTNKPAESHPIYPLTSINIDI